MFYAVLEDGIRRIDKEQFLLNPCGICVFTMEEWNRNLEWKELFHIWHDIDNMQYCRMESHRDFLFGMICVPAKEQKEETTFAVYIQRERVIILDFDGKIRELVEKLSKGNRRREYSLAGFLHDFLQFFLLEDLLYLEKLEQEIAGIEEDVLQGRVEHFSFQMLHIKKQITRFYHYYSQLMEIGHELLENQQQFFDEEAMRAFHMYSDRVYRLSEETKFLREYAMQVQEVYQSEIGIRQNDVMKMLTIVTTIFLPLSLIAGWYGMNFAYMPELSSRYSYPVVICISLLIVVISLVVFKKKKYW